MEHVVRSAVTDAAVAMVLSITTENLHEYNNRNGDMKLLIQLRGVLLYVAMTQFT